MEGVHGASLQISITNRKFGSGSWSFLNDAQTWTFVIGPESAQGKSSARITGNVAFISYPPIVFGYCTHLFVIWGGGGLVSAVVRTKDKSRLRFGLVGSINSCQSPNGVPEAGSTWPKTALSSSVFVEVFQPKNGPLPVL